MTTVLQPRHLPYRRHNNSYSNRATLLGVLVDCLVATHGQGLVISRWQATGEGANATLLTWNEEEEEEHCGFVDVVPAHAGRVGIVVAECEELSSRRARVWAWVFGFGALFRGGSGECGLEEEDLQWGGW